MKAFDFEEQHSDIIRVQDIMNKTGYDAMCEEDESEFEDLISQYRELTQEELANAGSNAFVQVYSDFKIIWDEDQKAMILALITFVRYAVNIACSGMKEVPEPKKDVIGKFFVALGEEIASEWRNGDLFFQPDTFTEDDYREVIEVFLSASLKPFESPYPFKLYQFIVACAVADKPNEAGLDKLRQLRKDYLAYVREKELGGKRASEDRHMHIDYRCYIKFRNKEIWKKLMTRLTMKDRDGAEHTFFDITQIFTDPRKMPMLLTDPMGEILDTLNSDEDMAFAFIHDHRKSPEYFEKLTAYIMDTVIANAKDDVIVIADYTDFNNDTVGDHVCCYFGGGKASIKNFVIPGRAGLERHEIEINSIEEILGDEYSKLSSEHKKTIKEFTSMD